MTNDLESEISALEKAELKFLFEHRRKFDLEISELKRKLAYLELLKLVNKRSKENE